MTTLKFKTGLQSRSTYKSGSYGLKHSVEELPRQRYTSNGDLIVALLLLGHSARFARGDGPNCQFKLVIKKILKKKGVEKIKKHVQKK